MPGKNKSESEEMYLATLARLNEAGGENPTPVARLAREMELLPVSVNQMVRKLEEEGLVEYTPYRGVALTGAGQGMANRILRQRRLWEVFLVERLGFSASEAQPYACRLEHVLPDEAIERLAQFLGNPVASPEGKGIPPPEGEIAWDGSFPLTAFKTGEVLVVSQLRSDLNTRAFLARVGLAVGKRVQVLAAGGRGDYLIRIEDGDSLHLAPDLVKVIWLKEAPPD